MTLPRIILTLLSLTTAHHHHHHPHLLPYGANALSLRPDTPRKQAVVVGAGPVGLAAALVLSAKHDYDVTLLESSSASTSQSHYDPTKAFLYLVNARGQTLTEMFPSMQRKLEERGVRSRSFADTKVNVVPSDPTEEIPRGKANVAAAASKTEERDGCDDGGGGGTSDGTNAAVTVANAAESEKAVSPGYWIPRHEMVKLMVECVEEHNRCGKGGKIDFLLGKECISVSPTFLDREHSSASAGGVLVTTQDVTNNKSNNNSNSNNIHTFPATLVIGADGMNSKVRDCLSRSNNSNNQWAKNCPPPKKFQIKKYTSPASHLRIKVLQFPPRFQIPNADGKPPIQTTSEEIYAIRSAFNGPRNYLSLGLLPMKDNDVVRPINIITRPDHEIWTIRDGPTMRSYFQKAFPRFDFSDDRLISPDEWDRFAKAEGTRFPSCQHSRGLAVWTDDGNGGVALVGDAAHAFSPDIGQGINAGLMDVVCLDRALSGAEDVETGKAIVAASSSSSPTLQTCLQRYQTQHSPEIAALIRLARFGAPYQYKQPHRIDRIRAKLWTLNLVLRLFLNKLTMGLVQPQCMLLAQDGYLTYREVMRRADLTTMGLKGVTLALIVLLVKKTLGLGVLTCWA